MGKELTIGSIQAEVEKRGYSFVTTDGVEAVLGATYPNDEDLQAALAALVPTVPWLTGFTVDWVTRIVEFRGPKTVL